MIVALHARGSRAESLAPRLAAALISLSLLLTACAGLGPQPPAAADMPMDPGMMARHMAPLPGEYTGLTNPILADADSLARGEQIYEERCAVCHGDRGWGDGPAAEALNPAPAPLAHTAGMLSDAHLFYRISEGGGLPPFDSAMPAFKGSLSVNERWDTVNYLHLLAEGAEIPGAGMMDEGPVSAFGGDRMDGMGMFVWMMLLPLALLVLFLAGAALIFLFIAGRSLRGAAGTPPSESALDVLRRRYASGEIDSEQFKQMKQDLEG